ncbi:ABC transporter substrate-binding protein [Salinibius halmophilus]|uniref:ABC transporter substrate-binding protein n=1 Tax=Salinibius halmophilus TaxID=1853216 RepID=UPI000E667BE1|nr:hypothetical protein [Salinibius halmophilus]
MMSRSALALLLVLLASTGQSFALAKIVFVHSYHAEFPWVEDYRRGLENQLPEHQTIHVFLDAKQASDETITINVEKAWQLVIDELPQVVVLADDAALKLLAPRLIERQVATVYLGINANPRDYGATGIRMTGVLERPQLKRSIAMIRQLLPEVDRIDVLLDSRLTADTIVDETLGNNGLVSNIEVNAYQFDQFSAWKAHVENLSDSVDALFLGTYAGLQNEGSVPIAIDEVSRWTSSNSPVPVFSFWSFSIADDMAIGGYVINGEQQGAEAGRLVSHYLRTGELLQVRSPDQGHYLFSQKQLTRWHLPLPRGDNILLRP